MSDTTITAAYCELFTHFDEDVPGDAYFTCSVCDRSVDDKPCVDHAPVEVPGLRLTECAAERGHYAFVHDRDDYGVQCPYCRLDEYAEQDRQARQCRHWGWRSWRITRYLTRRAYSLGVISGSCTSFGDGHDGCVTFSRALRGERPYILGVSREEWRCWLIGHHRRGEPVGFGFCGKCVPWPCCGSIREDHNTGCAEADPPVTFDPSVLPGGFVCAVPDPDRPCGICGMPVESEPCSEHSRKRMP